MAIKFVNNIDLQKNELQNSRIQNLASDPSNPVEGQIYHNTTDHKTYIYNGSGWVDATSQGSAPTYGTPATPLRAGTGAAPGANNAAIRTDATFQVLTAAATPIFSLQNLEGTSMSFARADHHHDIGAGVLKDTHFGASFKDGTAGTYSLRTIGTSATSAMAGNTTLSSIAAPTGSVSLNSQKITNLADGSAATDAATWGQVQNLISGLDAKQSVKAATATPVVFATDLENGDTIDGVALTTGDRILLKDMAAHQLNGIYTVNVSGAPTRATDMDAWGEVPNAYVWVEQGTANADTGWVTTANQSGSLGTTDIDWVQFNGLGQVTAGAGLTKTGNTLDVIGTADKITVNADSIDIAATYAGQSSITTVGTIATGTWNATTIAVGKGGTGQTTAKAARETGLGAAGYYTEVGTGSAATYTVTQATHGLRSSRFLVAQCQLVSDGSIVYTDTAVNASGDVTWTFAASQTLSNYQFTIVG